MTKQVKYTLCTMENNAHATFVQILNITYCNMNAHPFFLTPALYFLGDGS